MGYKSGSKAIADALAALNRSGENLAKARMEVEDHLVAPGGILARLDEIAGLIEKARGVLIERSSR